MKNAICFLLVIALLLNSGCATVFTGTSSSNHCKRKPKAGEPKREINSRALIADIIIFPPSLIVDFADGAIWLPCGYSRPAFSSETGVLKPIFPVPDTVKKKQERITLDLKLAVPDFYIP